MSRIKLLAAALVLTLPMFSCASYNAYQQARTAEQAKDWDAAVKHYEKALEIDDNNSMFKISLQRARLEASRVHFEKGKSLRAAYDNANGSPERLRLAQLAAQEMEMAVKLDPTNQYAAVELGKIVSILTDAQRAQAGMTIDEMKKRANRNISKAQPPALNPASDEPISLSFPRETPVKDIYRALGNAFGINILFDQGVKDDRISIELRDVTAQQALERVMQAANHFYKILDEKTIIVVPDNPQARRDYEDLVIRTFYLSNGDAEQVTNVVRTMIEARNVFPLKALNAITIRDTADKVRIAEKIIEANDKAKAEVVIDVELVQLDLNKVRDVGASIAGFSASAPGQLNVATTRDGKPVNITGGSATLGELRNITSGAVSFSVPTITYALLKSIGNSELLANPELRISEGEKATLHIGQRIPVPVSTFSSINTGTAGGAYSPVTSYQYQDVGIKVSMEPRVHHNREVTLKLTVEVSNQGPPVEVQGQPPQPTFATRTIESTIRLKDGETNFLAGLIQHNQEESSSKTPFLGDLPFVGRLFTRNHKGETRTDLVLTMTPHIVRIPDITDDDMAPMWVGTTNNLTFRGVSPRIESQSSVDPFTPTGRDPNAGLQLATDGEPGNYVRPDANAPAQPLLGSPGRTTPMPGSAPTNPFGTGPAPNTPTTPPPTTQTPPPNPQVQAEPTGPRMAMTASASSDVPLTQEAALRLSPRLSPQPVNLNVKPGEEKMWSVIGLDLEGLVATDLVFHYDPRTISVAEVLFGPAMAIDPKAPPVASVNRETGTIRIVSSDGKPLQFRSGGDVIMLRVFGALTGETFLVLENPEFKNLRGEAVVAAISGGRARVE